MTLNHNYECSNGDGTGIAGNYLISSINYQSTTYE